MNNQTKIQNLIDLGLAACDVIHTEIARGIHTQTKRDGSTVTNADHASERLIVQELRRMFPHTPVVSEEAHAKGESDAWQSHAWLVDPLDSTSGFARGSPDYAVIVGEVLNGRPVWGMVAVPHTRTVYVGDVSQQVAIKYESGVQTSIRCRLIPSHDVIVTHSPQERTPELQMQNTYRTWARGSALKFGLIAEGAADVYVRQGTLNLWDVAGGHALVQAAGGTCVSVNEQEIKYCSNRLYVPPFVARGIS